MDQAVQHASKRVKKNGVGPTIKEGKVAGSSSNCLMEESLEQKSLRMYTVLKSIMPCLGTKDLINARQVNKSWFNAATVEMLTQGHFQLHLWEESWKRRFYCQKSGKGRKILLEELIGFIEASLKFPCSSYSLHGENFDYDDVQEFFSKFGSTVRTLSLHSQYDRHYNHSRTPGKSFLPILKNVAPTIVKLEIIGNDLDDMWPGNTLDDLFLPSLKCLNIKYVRMESSAEVVEKLLKSAHNLNNIEDYNFAATDLLVKTKKIQYAKSLYFHPDTWNTRALGWTSGMGHMIETLNPWKLDDFQMLADARPTMQVLSLFWPRSPWFNSKPRQELLEPFVKILESSLSTLEDLTLGEIFHVADRGVELPILKKLKSLTLVRTWNQTGTFFPPSIDLTTVFPQLEKLNVYRQPDSFPWDNGNLPMASEILCNFSSVTTLEINRTCSMNILTQLHGLCPNIHKLKLVRLKMGEVETSLFPELCTAWQNLKVLELIFDDIQINMDHVITGFSNEDCERLILPKTMQRGIESDFEKLRTSSWIGNMTELRSFNVSYDICRRKKRSTLACPFTKVSCLYAFNLLPNLSVTVTTLLRDEYSQCDRRFRDALDSISSFATVYHERK